MVVAAFREWSEAGLAQQALSAQGIAAASHPQGNAFERLCADVFTGGVDVVVDRERAADAIAIIERLWPVPVEASTVERCEACSSTDLASLPRLRLFLWSATVLLVAGVALDLRDLFTLVAAIVGVILLLSPNRRCRACGERWTAPWRVAPENAVEAADRPCPKCNSLETQPIARRREKALTLLINVLMPPFFLIWPRLPRYRCADCGNEWR